MVNCEKKIWEEFFFICLLNNFSVLMFYFYDLYWEINYDLIKLQTFMLSLHTV